MRGKISRRRFWRKSAGISLAAGLANALPGNQAAAIWPGKSRNEPSLFDRYCSRIEEILKEFESAETGKISRAAEEAVRCLEKRGKLYCNLLGHLFYKNGGESAPDRIGNPVLFSRDTGAAKAGDFLVTMSPAEAKSAKERGVFCVGFTSPYFLNEETPPLALADVSADVLRNPENLMLSRICAITIRCHTPYHEGILESPLLSTPVIPATSQVTALFYWALAGEIVERLARKGIYPPIAGE
jgi:uncharacterized phosphosugar-binding protein